MADDIPTDGGLPPTPGPESNGAPPLLNIEDELSSSYLRYAMSVIVSRALPDARDGLKPVQRRILVAMQDLGLNASGSTSKCAGIIGETMKRYHPHGDSSIYDALVRMAQDWNLRYRLVHGQGNFGSVAGLPPAAHRYTEARLTHLSEDLLEDLNRETVDFQENYDGKYQEPLVLPGKVPNLLINGADGIAVGMATSIPPHNLREVCDGLIMLIDNPHVGLPELLSVIPGPDFPTGGIIRGRQGIIDGYKDGRGRITLRARADIVESGRTTQIIIKEVPFQVSRNYLAEKIGGLVRDDRIKDISAIRDESSARDGEPVRLVLDLKRGADPNIVLNQLYDFSPLQKTVSVIMLALVDGRPRKLSLKEMLEEYIRHRRQVIRRRTEYQLREAKRRGHILEGQLIAISSLEEVIATCRRSPSRAEAKLQLQRMEVAAAVLQRALGDEAFEALQRELGKADVYTMTEQQADAVVRLQLGQLAALERDEIFKEFINLREQINIWEGILSDETKVLDIIREDLIRLRDRYGDDRRTEISDEGGRVNLEDLITEEDVIVSLSHNGYIKRLALDTYRAQHRGGKGVSGGLGDGDFIEHFFIASTHAYLLCFTDRGQVYWLKVYDIPEMSRTSAGRSIANVLSLRAEEKVSSIIPVRRFEEGYSLLMATKKGYVKKTDLSAYSRPKQGGIIGINLEDDDTLMRVVLTKTGDEVVLCTRNGQAIRFAESDAREMGRNTRGVKGITLVGDDEMVDMVVANPEGFLLTVCENGYGKRTPFGPNTPTVGDESAVVDGTEDASIEEPIEEPTPEEPLTEESEGEPEPVGDLERGSNRYRRQRRGGKGVKDIRTNERNGKVVGVASVSETDDIMLITHMGMVNRTHVSEIRITGRNTSGVRVMNMKAEGDRIASIAPVAREELDESDIPNVTADTPTPESDTEVPHEIPTPASDADGSADVITEGEE